MSTSYQHNKEVDDYIDLFDGIVAEKLHELRAIIMKAAPDSEEVISYKMPAYKQDGMLVYFAGYKHHIGLYPTSTPIIHFAEEIKKFKSSKGAIQFPLDKPLPKKLITDIVKFKVKENKEKLLLKKQK